MKINNTQGKVILLLYNLVVFLYIGYFLNSNIWKDIFYYVFIRINALILINLVAQLFLLRKATMKDIDFKVVAASLFAPFIEELFFRLILPNHLEYIFDKQITNIICSICFGLSHIPNYWLLDDTGNKYVSVIFQCIITTAMGYELSLLKSLTLSILLHTYYNNVSLSILFMMKYKREPKENYSSINHINMKGIREVLYLPKQSIDFEEGTLLRYHLSYETVNVNTKQYEIYNKMSLGINELRALNYLNSS